MSGRYSWTKDNEPITAVTAQTSGIAKDTIHSNNLEIISMTRQLVGIYQCILNDNVQNTFDVKIVGRFLYRFSESFIILCCSVQTQPSTAYVQVIQMHVLRILLIILATTSY